MTTSEILTRLSAGNKRFANDQLNSYLQDSLRRKSIIDTQKPFAIILGCTDSRIVPELIFDTGLGELFVVRVAGNIANKSSVASIEFAVAHLNCKVIMVLGHQNCGAVTEALKGGDYGENMNHLLSYLTPAITASAKMATVDDVVKTNAKLTIEELKNRSDILKKAANNGDVIIVPAFYDMDSGFVEFFS
ncbi:MAG: carbonic anhydrase [Draconibacterium sp.]|nr:carbonic anhydrase [Draconibacterium sp.]